MSESLRLFLQRCSPAGCVCARQMLPLSPRDLGECLNKEIIELMVCAAKPLNGGSS